MRASIPNIRYLSLGHISTKNTNVNVACFLCKYIFEIKVQYNSLMLFRDDEEWFKYRKLLNPLMMRDTDWMVLPIQRMCEKAVQSLSEGVTKDNPSYEIQNIESTLYKWSIEGKYDLKKG